MSANTNKERKGLYRSRSGVILGVCKGLAQYFDLSIFWTRVVAVGFLIFTGLWPIVGLYLLAALLMKPEPVVKFRDDVDHEFYNSYTTSRRMAIRRLKRTYDNLDRRLRRMEDRVTTKEFDWDRRFNQT
jgi:phage shock protein C